MKAWAGDRERAARRPYLPLPPGIDVDVLTPRELLDAALQTAAAPVEERTGGTDPDAALQIARGRLARLAQEIGAHDPFAASVLLADRGAARVGTARLLAAWTARLDRRDDERDAYPWDPPRLIPTIGSARADREIGVPVGTADRRAPRALRDALGLVESTALLLEASASGGDQVRSAGDRLLAELRPRIEADVASCVMGSDAWRDTLLLWLVTRRERVLAELHPLAFAIANRYAMLARRSAGLVCGNVDRDRSAPLVSASAHLASALWAIGYFPSLVPGLVAFVQDSMGPLGGWKDPGESEDPLTTLAAADLLLGVDPGFDGHPTATFLARLQRRDGGWGVGGNEVPWLTAAVVEWLERRDLPFHQRFRWPACHRWERDRKTGIPGFAHFGQLARAFADLDGLAGRPVGVAFVDLAGFHAFNNRFGMALGDRVLREFAQALAELPGATAIRDGGDEFLVVGAPERDGLASDLDAFRVAWPGRFASVFGTEAPPVAPRILVTATDARGLVAARDVLGERIGALKEEHPQPDQNGVLVDIVLRPGATPR